MVGAHACTTQSCSAHAQKREAGAQLICLFHLPRRHFEVPLCLARRRLHLKVLGFNLSSTSRMYWNSLDVEPLTLLLIFVLPIHTPFITQHAAKAFERPL